jgi:lariat debranching enzyme
MKTFYKYYNGERRAPIPTVYVAGNHEASNHHLEVYVVCSAVASDVIPFNSIPLCYLLRAIARFHGGWVAPNIYYMGSCGVVQFGGLRIAGLSGIFKQQDYRKGKHPRSGLFVSGRESLNRRG